jgi:hypothetical protein
MTLDLVRADYNPLRRVLEDGRTQFYEGIDLYGDAQLIRLVEVMHVKDCSPEGIANADREDDDHRQYKLVESL